MLAEFRQKAQVTIPKEIIVKLGLSEGDKLDIFEKDGSICIMPVVVYPKKYLSELKEEIGDVDVYKRQGADNKSMVSLRQLQCQLPPDLVRFFRRDLARLERLSEMVGNHIVRAPVTSGQVRILALG